MSEIIYEIKSELGCLREFPNGWRKLVQIVNWNNSSDKIDIRDWDENKTHMTRGITLTFDEFKKLKSIDV